jgi:hypothetical protein
MDANTNHTPYTLPPDAARDQRIRDWCQHWNYVYTPFADEGDALVAANLAADLFKVRFKVARTDQGNYMVLPA